MTLSEEIEASVILDCDLYSWRRIVKAYEFQTRVTADGKLEVPEVLFEEIRAERTVRVIVLISEPTDARFEDQAWAHLTAEQFLAGYSDADAIYDQMA